MRSFTRAGTLRPFASAMALVSALPLLMVWYLSTIHAVDGGSAPQWETMVACASVTCFFLLGYVVLRRYPTNVRKLRRYLEQMIAGEVPDIVSLNKFEDDTRAIEECLNVIVARLRTKISSIEAEKDYLERQLFQSQKLETVGALAAGIAHEINTPVQFVKNNTRYIGDSVRRMLDLLDAYRRALAAREDAAAFAAMEAEVRSRESRLDLPALGREVVDAIAESEEGLGRVVEITQAMRSYLHPGLGGDKAATDLNQLVRDTMTLSRNEWKHVAKVRLELDEDLPPVPCWPGLVQQVFMNLIINAAAAIQGVGVDASRTGTITVRTGVDGGAAVVSIADTGLGIPERNRPRIFERFFTTKAPGKGTGLGLALARTVVEEKHGGSITFESAEGRGTNFTVTLPLGDAYRPGGSAKSGAWRGVPG